MSLRKVSNQDEAVWLIRDAEASGLERAVSAPHTATPAALPTVVPVGAGGHPGPRLPSPQPGLNTKG